MPINNTELMRNILNCLFEDDAMSIQKTNSSPPNVQQKNIVPFNGINGPLNINSLATALGIKNINNFSQAIGRLKNPPPGADITKILTVPQMAELATAFYLLLTDNTGKKAQVLNQIRLLTSGANQ